MISKYKNNGLVWIDLTSPQKEEVLYVLEEYEIPERIRLEIYSSSEEPKTFIEEGTLFSIIKIPLNQEEDNFNKIIFIKNPNYTITIHDQPIGSIERFSNELELDMSIASESQIKTQELLFANLTRTMISGLSEDIVSKDRIIGDLKKKVLVFKKSLKVFYILNLILIASLFSAIILWR